MSFSNDVFTGQENLERQRACNCPVDPRLVVALRQHRLFGPDLPSPVHLHLQHSLLAEPPFPVVGLLNLALPFQFS